MSKTNTSKTEQPNQKASSHGFLKFLSVLLLAVFVAALFVPKYFQLSGSLTLLSGSVAGNDQSVFAVILDDIKSLSSGGAILTLLNAHKVAWMLAICAVVLLLSTIITLCCKKSAGGWFGIDCGILVVVALPYAYKCLLGANKYLDLFLVACALALVFLVITAFARGKGKNVIPVICFIALSAVAVLTCMYAFLPGKSLNLFSEGLHWYLTVLKNLISGKAIESLALYELMTYITLGVLLVCWALTVFQLGTVKKTTWFTVIRYLVLLGVSVVGLVLVLTDKAAGVTVANVKESPYYVILVAVVLVVFLLSLIARLTAKKKVKEAKAESSQSASAQEDETEVAQDGADAPVYNAPVYSAPVYPAPVYAAPIYAAPTYGNPSYANSAYNADPNAPVVGQSTMRGYDRNARMAPPPTSPADLKPSKFASSAAVASPYANAVQPQPVAPAYPMPNIYINITNGTTGAPAEVKVTHEEPKSAAQTAVVTTASAATTTVETQEPETIEEKADLIESKILEEEVKEEVVEATPVVNAIAVSETTTADKSKAKKQKTKRRSFWLFLGILFTVAALAIYAFLHLDSLLKVFTEISLNLEAILPVAFLGGGALAVLFGLISLAGANKPCGVIAFLLTVVSAAGYLVNVQLYGASDILTSVTSLNYEFIAIAACEILAVLCCFIGAVRTGKIKSKEVATTETKETKAVAAAPAAKETKAVAAAPAAKEEKTAAVAQPEPVENAVAEEESSEPEEEIDDPFIKSLSVLNKKEFRKTFLEGNPPSYLPEYEINGDNDDFFDAVFVYLGKIRPLISPSLLAAIYDYMNK